MSSELTTLEIPDFRFYHILFYDDGIKGLVDEITQRLPADMASTEVNLIKLNNFPYKQYNSLGVVEYKLGEIDTSNDYKPIGVFQNSRKILDILYSIDDERDDIFVDRLNLHPYALTIASKISSKSKILWSPTNINKYKKTLGGWIEYYSGQWDDYSEELYDERVESNLSNRLSELHYIKSNSAFIFMPRHDPRWPDWMEYMENNFIRQILQTKAIMFVLMLLNEELDAAGEKIRQLTSDDIIEIDKEMMNIENLQMLIADLSSELNRERLMNRLHHSTKVVKRCFEVFSLDKSKKIIDTKINNLQEMVKSMHAVAQNKLQNQQKRWILILNGLVGYQVAFTMLDNLSTSSNASIANFVATYRGWFDGVIWGSLIVLAGISTYGLIKTLITRRRVKRKTVGKIVL